MSKEDVSTDQVNKIKKENKKRGPKEITYIPGFNFLKGKFQAGELSLSQIVRILEGQEFKISEEAFRRRCHEGELTLGGEKLGRPSRVEHLTGTVEEMFSAH